MTKKTFASVSKQAPKPVQPRGILSSHKEEEAIKKTKKKPGRPAKSSSELARNKLTLYFTDSEKAIIEEKAGLVSVAKHLRHTLNEFGYFDK